MWAKQINVWKSTAHGSGFIYLPLMSGPSIILRRELKMFPLGAECQSQSTNTFRSLFPAPRGHRAGSCPRHKGESSNHAGTGGGVSLRSCEVYGLKSGCQSAVIAQWEWAPPLGQSASQRAAINKLSTLSPEPVRLEPQGARSLNFPKHCSLLLLFLLPPTTISSSWLQKSDGHTSLLPLSAWNGSDLSGSSLYVASVPPK